MSRGSRHQSSHFLADRRDNRGESSNPVRPPTPVLDHYTTRTASLDIQNSPRYFAVSMDKSNEPSIPPILRLPAELHLQIVSYFTTEVWHNHRIDPPHRCTMTRRVPCTRLVYYEDCCIVLTDPTILSLRYTNTYFYRTINLSQKLLLQIQRNLNRASRTSCDRTRDLLACCVCLRLRHYSKFGTVCVYQPPCHIQHRKQQITPRYQFCVDCGFAAYPYPHPALAPRRQQLRRGVEPVSLTSYAPGTKIRFPFQRSNDVFYVWVWCLDCRLLKTSKHSGDIACSLFCKECCIRLGCRVTHSVTGVPIGRHADYMGIEDEVKREAERRKERLSVGALFVASGSSLLMANKEGGVGEEEDDYDSDQNDAEWKTWFDFSDTITFLPQNPPWFSNRVLKVHSSRCVPAQARLGSGPRRSCGSVHP